MTADEFVRIVEARVRDSAATAAIENLSDPPGRAPDPELVALSKWYLALAELDRAVVSKIVRLAADYSAFGFLCILDGVRGTGHGPQTGHLEVYYVNGEHRQLLNDPHSEPLNDKFRA